MLMRWDPFREIDRLTDQLWQPVRSQPMPMEAYRRGDAFVAAFDVPGVDRDSIEITVDQNVLTVKAERRFTRNETDEVIVAERPQGTWSRQLFLGEGVDTNRIDANLENGVLTLTVPVAEAARPRQIQIGGTDKSQAIEAESRRSEPAEQKAS
jgi:HSP20 family protein